MNRCYLLLLFASLTYSSLLPAQTFDWAKGIGIGSSNIFSSLVITHDSAGNVYTGGSFYGTMDFDPGPGTFIMTSNNEVGFVLKLDANGNFLWAEAIGDNGLGEDVVTSITIGLNGDVYVTGYFDGSNIDFDPGPGLFNLSALGTNDDIFIQKLNSGGVFQWAVSMGTMNTNERPYSIATDTFGNVYTTGMYFNNSDFDPGAGTFTLTCNPSYWGCFISKLNSSGNFVWAKGIAGNSGIAKATGMGIEIDHSGNVLVSGSFGGTVDFDPGAGVFNLTASTSENIFVEKLDPNGTFIWNKVMPTVPPANHGVAQSIVVDAFDNIYTAGYYEDTTDFDPGPGTFLLPSDNVSDLFIQKMTSTGNFLWAKHLPVSGDEGVDLAIDINNNIYLTGVYFGTVDFDPGPGIHNLSCCICNHGFILKMDSYGNYIWAGHMGGNTPALQSNSISIDNSGNILNTGDFGNSNMDVDPTAGVYFIPFNGLTDIYVLKLNQDSCSWLTLVIDSVNNITCSGAGTSGVHAHQGQPPYSYQWNTIPPTLDSVAVFSDPGIYTVSVTDAMGCTRSSSLLVNGPVNQSGYDLQSLLVATPFRPGFPSTIWLDGFNNRCVTASGTMYVVLDTQLTYNSASPTPSSINGDTLFWNFSNLNYDSAHIRPQISVTTQTNVQFGDPICFDLNIGPLVNDSLPFNNSGSYCFVARSSYDPNDKTVYPKGSCDAGYLVNQDELTYIIRFQNTGTYEAENIYVMDTLDPSLDISTLDVISKSHNPLITEILPGNIIKFRLDNIMLADSTTNEPASHGYIIYTIDLLSGLSLGTQIENSASIYFDFNLPVLTNKVSNIITDSIPNTFSTILVNACDIYQGPSGQHAWTTDGTYSDIIPNYEGCDSVITVNLSILHSTDETISVSACNSYISPSAQHTWTQSGTYQDIIPNAQGCDSVITIQLTILNNYSSLNANGCGSYQSPSGNYLWNVTGTYTDILTNSSGCDSIITVHLTIFNADTAVSQSGSSLIASASFATFQWLDCSNGFSVISGATNGIFYPTTSGNYAVAVTESGCTDTSGCHFITILELFEGSSPFFFNIYPNPANETVIVSSTERIEKITLINSLGEVILEQNAGKVNEFKLDLSRIQKGIVLVKVSAGGRDAFKILSLE